MIDGELMKLKELAQEKMSAASLSQTLLPSMIYHTLSFDSSSISEELVAAVVDGKLDGIDKNKILLVLNQKNAILYVFKMIEEDIPMDENNLKDLHQILMHGFSDIGGLYRNVDIAIDHSNHTPPSHIKVYDRMRKYFDFTLSDPTGDLFEFISYCHVQLAKIHPFLDGNGRLSRLVLDYQLLKRGFAPIIITKENQANYFSCLEAFKVEKNIAPFVELLMKLEKSSLQNII